MWRVTKACLAVLVLFAALGLGQAASSLLQVSSDSALGLVIRISLLIPAALLFEYLYDGRFTGFFAFVLCVTLAISSVLWLITCKIGLTNVPRMADPSNRLLAIAILFTSFMLALIGVRWIRCVLRLNPSCPSRKPRPRGTRQADEWGESQDDQL